MAERTPLFMDLSNVYSGDELGLPYRDIMGEGIVGVNDLKVSQTTVASLSVDIAVGSAWILGDTNPAAQPCYRVYNDAIVNKGISPDPTNPRKVLIVAQIVDEGFAGTGRLWRIDAIHGTPAGAPVEPALPASAIPLALIDVTAADASIATAQITDRRVVAKLGGQVAGSGGGGTLRAIDLKNPQVAINAGNCFPTVLTLTDHEQWVWSFLKDVDGKLFGSCRIPDDATIAAQKVVLGILCQATTGVSRLSVATKAVADAETLSPAALLSVAAQDVAIPGTAYLRKDVTFVQAGETWMPGDEVLVEVYHEGAHVNDTVAQSTFVMDAYLKLV